MYWKVYPPPPLLLNWFHTSGISKTNTGPALYSCLYTLSCSTLIRLGGSSLLGFLISGCVDSTVFMCWAGHPEKDSGGTLTQLFYDIFYHVSYNCSNIRLLIFWIVKLQSGVELNKYKTGVGTILIQDRSRN